MPEAGGRPHDQYVDEPARPALSIAAQRDIEIIAEPRAQRDMPAPPEIGDAARHIGIVEIAHEFKPEHAPQPHGHIGIAGKVKIDLEREGDYAQPCPHAARRGGGLVHIPQRADAVGQQHLLGQADDEHIHARGKLGDAARALAQLVVQIAVLQDRAGDELREERHERAERHEVSLRARLAAVEVYGVGHGLEGVKRYADGQRQPQRPER